MEAPTQEACRTMHDKGKTDSEIAQHFKITEREAFSMRRFGRLTKHRAVETEQAPAKNAGPKKKK